MEAYLENFHSFEKENIFVFDYENGGIGDFFKFFSYALDFSIANQHRFRVFVTKHPIFEHFEILESKIVANNIALYEYQEINKLENIITSNSTKHVIKCHNMYGLDFSKTSYYLGQLFTFSSQVIKKGNEIIGNRENFISLHVRKGDKYIEVEEHHKAVPNDSRDFDETQLIQFIASHQNENIMLFCDSKEYRSKLKNDFKYLIVSELDISHTSYRITSAEQFFNTIVEFYIISKSKKVYSAAKSGFPIFASIISNKPIHFIGIEDTVTTINETLCGNRTIHYNNTRPQPFIIDNIGSDIYYFAFDIFLKDNKIHFICPLYSKEHDTTKIKVLYGSKELQLLENIVFASNKFFESTQILIFEGSKEEKMSIDVHYDHIHKQYHLKKLKLPCRKLVQTTLFIHAEYLFPMMFYKFYKNHGVEHFYLYFNGEIPDKIKNHHCFNNDDVTLIPWNYRYWNNQSQCSYLHHAQMGQINHALYKYGKGSSEYMMFNDFDEYFAAPLKIYDLISKTNYNCYGFENRWAKLYHGDFPNNVPFKIRVSKEAIGYPCQSKNIWKCSVPTVLMVHNSAIVEDVTTSNGTKTTRLERYNYEFRPEYMYEMYHFCDWHKQDNIQHLPNMKIMSYKNVRIGNAIPICYKHFYLVEHRVKCLFKQTVLPDEIILVISDFTNKQEDIQLLDHLKIEAKNIGIVLNYNVYCETQYAGLNREIAFKKSFCDLIIFVDCDDIVNIKRNEIIREAQSKTEATHLIHSFTFATAKDEALCNSSIENYTVEKIKNWDHYNTIHPQHNGVVSIMKHHLASDFKFPNLKNGQDKALNEKLIKQYNNSFFIKCDKIYFYINELSSWY